jgi:hypothetical protein
MPRLHRDETDVGFRPSGVRHGSVATIDALLKLPLLHDSSTVSDGSGSDWRSWLDQITRRTEP